MREPNAIGIDLGTTFSVVAVVRNGHVEIIQNEQGDRTTPSCVAFTDSERLVGKPAVEQAAFNLTNTVYSVKRVIGRRFTDAEVQEDMKTWPFKVLADHADKPNVEVQWRREQRTFYPEEISSMTLAKLKSAAQAFLEYPVVDAVITVPAYFNDAQKEATEQAGRLAGLNVLRLLSEPTAAGIAYGVDRLTQPDRTILVYDLGGGTFDVSVILVTASGFDVKAVNGDPHLGGDDFDQRLVSHCVSLFKAKHKKDLSTIPYAMRRLRTACERAKCRLSSATHWNIVVDSIMDGMDLNMRVSRACFEDVCRDKFQSTIPLVEKALEDAGMAKGDIDHVVLVGGSTRIPKIQQLLTEFFEGKTLNTGLNADEAVAYGAAVFAAKLSGDDSEVTRDVVLSDVTPLSLGVAVGKEGTMDVVIKRNTTIPVSKTKIYTTLHDNQSSVDVKVYEGERVIAAANNLLGRFDLTGIPPAPKEVPQIEVTFQVNHNAMLSVSAVDLATKNNNEIVVKTDKGRHSKEEIDRMIRVAVEDRMEDEEHLERLGTLNALEEYCNKISEAIGREEINMKLDQDQRLRLKRLLREAQSYTDGRFCDVTINATSVHIKKLRDAWEPLVRQWYVPPQPPRPQAVEPFDRRLRWHDLITTTTLALAITCILAYFYEKYYSKR